MGVMVVRRGFWGLLLVVIVALPAACREAGALEVREVWGRAVPASAPNAAFYLTVENRGAVDDRLIAVSAAACAAAELHETYAREPGVMGMRPVDGGILVPAGAAVRLEPGGAHVMCLGQNGSFTVGASLPLTLTFVEAGEVPAQAAVRRDAP